LVGETRQRSIPAAPIPGTNYLEIHRARCQTVEPARIHFFLQNFSGMLVVFFP
jgi:hypothetical protein